MAAANEDRMAESAPQGFDPGGNGTHMVCKVWQRCVLKFVLDV